MSWTRAHGSFREDPPQRGNFWLAGAREHAVPGRLTLGPEGPRIELDGTLTSGMRSETVRTEDGSTLTSQVPVIGEDEVLTVYGQVGIGGGTKDVTLVHSITTIRT